MKGKRKFRHRSLFSGIGGFDLAAGWMGWDNVFHCELSAFCKQVLSYYYPKAKSYGNIKETDFRPHRSSIDILTGDFLPAVQRRRETARNRR
ncbi:DNA cytosine methyltransferase [Pedobacter sp. P26]|uniref:DNA cytosine methyltransferase n=1 Tax=Pedobacter sp. P26 TaxID=3423956 RepID=UPI003D668B2E